MKLSVAPEARRDVTHVLRWSAASFGQEARARYSALIRQAYLDILANPQRPGVRLDPPVLGDLRLYHLRHSRSHTAAQRVGSPRHVIVFRLKGDLLEVARILHDSMDLPRHLQDL